MKIGLLNKGPEFWIAGAASLAIHLVVISIFCFTGGGDKKDSPSEPRKRPAVVEETTPPAPVNPVQAEEPPPISSSPKETVASTSRPKAKTPAKTSPKKAKPAEKPAVAKTDDDVSLDAVTQPLKTETKTEEKTETASYVVKAGDSLYRIAREYSCTVSELAKLNNTDIKKLSNLRKGQTIRVPKTTEVK